MEAIRELFERFKAHAEHCPGCTTSLEVGTWLAHRCSTGKHMTWELHDLMAARKAAKDGEQS
jgi:hypothetical protein